MSALARLLSYVESVTLTTVEIKGDASKRRFFAANLDAVVALVPGMVLATNLTGVDPLLRGAVLCLVYLGYFILCETLWSRTLGKHLFGLRVRGLDGRPCTGQQALIRGLMRVLDANPLFFGGLPAVGFVLLTKRNQRLGDLLAGTVVTRTPTEKERVEPAALEAFD